MAKKNIKRLYRADKKDSMLGGVCAGIADYFEVDPTVVRLVWVVMTMLTVFGPGIIGYIVMWIIMPRRN
ncbi:PspC domain-containing protein [Candidatus Pacearchaeota archaeon]|nr:PspC domain-containing protein [Candidatus Pacearchaeota archaeon]